MSADLIKDVISPEFNKQVNDARSDLKKLNDQFIDTLKAALQLRDATAASTTFADLTKNVNAASQAQKKLKDDTDEQANAAAKLQDAEAKRLNAYLVGLSKEQAARDNADAKEMAANQKRLDAIAKEQAALEAAAAKRKATLSSDDERFNRPSLQDNPVFTVGGNSITDAEAAAGTAKTEALANEKAALIASVEVEQLSTEAKIKNATATEGSNAALIANIEFNNSLKTQLAGVNAEIKESTVFNAELTAEQLRLTQAIRDNNQVISQQIKLDNAAAGSNLEERASLEILRAEYNALSAAEKANAEIGGKKLAQIQELAPKVAASAKELGKFGDNVGNYPFIDRVIERFSSLDRVGARVLQGLGRQIITLGTGLLSFAVGAKAIELIGTALVALAEKYDLFGNKVTAATEILKDFNAVQKSANIDLGKTQTVFKILTDTANDTTLSLKERTAAGAELIKQFPKELEGTTALSIANGEEKTKLDALSASLIQNAKARAALAKIEELQSKILDTEFQKEKIRNAESNEQARLKKDIANGALDIGDGSGILEGDADAKIKKRANDAVKIQDENKKILQQQIDFLVKYAGGEANLAKVIETDDKKKDPKTKIDNTDEEALKKQIANLKSQAENERLSYENRIGAAKNFYDLSNQLAELQSRKAIAAKKNTNDVFTLEDANRLAAQQETDKLLLKIDEDANKERLETLIKNHDDLEKEIQKYSDTEQIQLAKNYANQQQALALQYSQGLLSEDQYNVQKKQLADSYSNVTVDDQISTLEELRDNDIAFGGDGIKYQHQIDELKVKSAKDANAQLIIDEEATGKKLADQKKKANTELKKLAKEGADAVIDLIQKVGDAQFDYEKQQIDSQKTALDTQTQRQIDAENASLDSSKSKADKIALINAQANDKKAQLDKEARKIDHDKAVFDREIAIAKIIEQTAIAIVSAIAEFGIYGTAVGIALGAIGAAQIALVLAQPLPAFADGGVMKRTGMAKFGELGQEYRIEPSGEVSLTPGTTTIGMVKKGTRFIDAETTTKILTRPESIRYVGGEQMSTKQMEKYLKEIKESLNKPQPWVKKSEYPAHWNTDYFRSKIN